MKLVRKAGNSWLWLNVLSEQSHEQMTFTQTYFVNLQ